MTIAKLLCDWTTVAGSGYYLLRQTAEKYVDAIGCKDVTVFLEVAEVTNAPLLYIETSPMRDERLFVGLVGSFVPTAGVRVDVVRYESAVSPLSRYVRWRVIGNGVGYFSMTFRIWLALNESGNARRVAGSPRADAGQCACRAGSGCTTRPRGSAARSSCAWHVAPPMGLRTASAYGPTAALSAFRNVRLDPPSSASHRVDGQGIIAPSASVWANDIGSASRTAAGPPPSPPGKPPPSPGSGTSSGLTPGCQKALADYRAMKACDDEVLAEFTDCVNEAVDYDQNVCFGEYNKYYQCGRFLQHNDLGRYHKCIAQLEQDCLNLFFQSMNDCEDRLSDGYNACDMQFPLAIYYPSCATAPPPPGLTPYDLCIGHANGAAATCLTTCDTKYPAPRLITSAGAYIACRSNCAAAQTFAEYKCDLTVR